MEKRFWKILFFHSHKFVGKLDLSEKTNLTILALPGNVQVLWANEITYYNNFMWNFYSRLQ